MLLTACTLHFEASSLGALVSELRMPTLKIKSKEQKRNKGQAGPAGGGLSGETASAASAGPKSGL